jgi:hypothetical protein
LAEMVKPPKAVSEIIESAERRSRQIAQAATLPKAFSELAKVGTRPSSALSELSRAARFPTATLESIGSELIESQNRWREELKALTEPMRSALDQMKSAMEPFRIRPLAEWEAHLSKIVEPQRRFQQYFSSPSQFRDSFERLADLGRTLAETARIEFEGSVGITSPSGEMVISSDAVNSEAVTASLAELAEKVAEATTPADYFRRFADSLRRLPVSLAFIILVKVIDFHLSILANLTTPFFQPWYDRLIGQPQQEVVTSIAEAPRQNHAYRFVRAKHLQVWFGDGPDERVIAELPLGKIVKVIEIKKRWSLIEYVDETEQKLTRGWVLDFYISSFAE